jgi:hypothetical protein
MQEGKGKGTQGKLTYLSYPRTWATFSDKTDSRALWRWKPRKMGGKRRTVANGVPAVWVEDGGLAASGNGTRAVCYGWSSG